MTRSIWIGWDPRERLAYSVCARSIETKGSGGAAAHALVLGDLMAADLYIRPTEIRDGRMWDAVSAAPMSTEFAISRFFVPLLARTGWALFMDCDMMCRADLETLFGLADPDKAVMCVQHRHDPVNRIKMDGQVQTAYPRKNWSSVMLFNCDHPANAALTLDLVNSAPGRDLHRFCWLADDEIGALPAEWNWLAGVSDPSIDPALVHYTDGGPWFEPYRDAPYADEWRAYLDGAAP